MRINNFKELERQEMQKLDPAVNRIKSNVNSNLGMFHFIGNITELFLPKIFGLFLSMFGGNDDTDTTEFPKNKYPNTGG